MIPRPLFLLPAAFLAACASDSGSSAASAPAASGARETSLDSWVSEKTRDNGFVADASGNLVPKSNKRSSFETQRESPHFKNRYEKKTYQAGDYAKKSFWGKSDYAPKAYAGNTDGSRFATRANAQGRDASEAGEGFATRGYDTTGYDTGNARESGAERIERISDAETDVRRRVFTPPAVQDWRAARSLSQGETKSLLGR